MRCEGGQKARCSYCMSDLATGGGNTSGLKKHLKTKHPGKFKEFSKEAEEREKDKESNEESNKRKKSNGADDNQEKIDAFLGRDKYENDSVTQTKFDEAMVDFFADYFVPF